MKKKVPPRLPISHHRHHFRLRAWELLLAGDGVCAAPVLVFHHPHRVHPAQVPHTRGAWGNGVNIVNTVHFDEKCKENTFRSILGDMLRQPRAQLLSTNSSSPGTGQIEMKFIAYLRIKEIQKFLNNLWSSHLFCPISGGPKWPAPSRPVVWSAASADPWCIPPGGTERDSSKLWVGSLRSFCF